MNRIEARTVVGLNVMTVIVIRKKERNKYHYFFELKHVFNSIQFFVGTNAEREREKKRKKNKSQAVQMACGRKIH